MLNNILSSETSKKLNTPKRCNILSLDQSPNNLQYANIPHCSSLRCDALGKITRLVHIKSPENSEVICQ